MTLIVLPVLLLLVGLVVYVGMIRDARTESQNGADAAALAAGLAMVHDDLLRNDLGCDRPRLQAARSMAMRVGHENVSAGKRLELSPNLQNDPDGDIVFGYLDEPLSVFQVALCSEAEWAGHNINTVRVTNTRDPIHAPFGGASPDRAVRARSTVMLDHRVVGFRPTVDAPVPLMPIGVLTDHIGLLPMGWDAHCRTDTDEWKQDAVTGEWVPGQDLIPEIVVVLGPRAPGDQLVPAAFVQLGVDSFDETVTQLREGVTRAQIEAKYGSGLVLGPDNILPVPGTAGCPKPNTPGRQKIDESLRSAAQRAEPWIFPLFSKLNEETGTLHVTGWMAARIVLVSATPEGGLALTLQPAVLHQASAVTESRANPPAFWANNKTIVRVRLAQ